MLACCCLVRLPQLLPGEAATAAAELRVLQLLLAHCCLLRLAQLLARCCLMQLLQVLQVLPSVAATPLLSLCIVRPPHLLSR